MIRFLARSIAINAAGIYIVVKVLSGIFVIEGGIAKFLTAALAISLINLIVRPIINLLLLPINLLTLGLLRWVGNIGVLFLATKLVPEMQIHEFISPKLELPFLIIPSFEFSKFGAFIFVTLFLSLVFHIVYWLFQE